mmetsp:Transcript_17336/g.54159  ORF Transcript_17336/g.54159 Transcript_17336/m.54159 type:complete len:308 (-) Transcript_17336:1045-1968(-)
MSRMEVGGPPPGVVSRALSRRERRASSARSRAASSVGNLRETSTPWPRRFAATSASRPAKRRWVPTSASWRARGLKQARAAVASEPAKSTQSRTAKAGGPSSSSSSSTWSRRRWVLSLARSWAAAPKKTKPRSSRTTSLLAATADERKARWSQARRTTERVTGEGRHLKTASLGPWETAKAKAAATSPAAKPVSRPSAWMAAKVKRSTRNSEAEKRRRACQSHSAWRSMAIMMRVPPKAQVGTTAVGGTGATSASASSAATTTSPESLSAARERMFRIVWENMYEPEKPPRQPEQRFPRPTVLSSAS